MFPSCMMWMQSTGHSVMHMGDPEQAVQLSFMTTV
jgi:hypothetical protein